MRADSAVSIYTAQQRCSEKDIDEVLQTHFVYTNVSKGVLATSKDLLKAFETGKAAQPSDSRRPPVLSDLQYPFRLTSECPCVS
jgi:hypothetical protein